MQMSRFLCVRVCVCVLGRRPGFSKIGQKCELFVLLRASTRALMPSDARSLPRFRPSSATNPAQISPTRTFQIGGRAAATICFYQGGADLHLQGRICSCGLSAHAGNLMIADKKKKKAVYIWSRKHRLVPIQTFLGRRAKQKCIMFPQTPSTSTPGRWRRLARSAANAGELTHS